MVEKRAVTLCSVLIPPVSAVELADSPRDSEYTHTSLWVDVHPSSVFLTNTTAVYSVSNQPPLLFQMEYPTPVVARCNPSWHCTIAKALTPLKKLVRNAVSYIPA